MASAQSKTFVKAVAKSLELSVAAGTATGSYMQDKGTKSVKVTGTAIEFLSSQLDVAMGLIEASAKKGKVDKATLYSLLLSKGLSFGDFIPSDSAQCMSALASLGLGLGRMVVAAPTGAGALWAGAMLLSDVYATYVDCKDPFNAATDEGKKQIGVFGFKLENAIKQLYGVPGF